MDDRDGRRERKLVKSVLAMRLDDNTHTYINTHTHTKQTVTLFGSRFHSGPWWYCWHFYIARSEGFCLAFPSYFWSIEILPDYKMVFSENKDQKFIIQLQVGLAFSLLSRLELFKCIPLKSRYKMKRVKKILSSSNG